MLTQSIDYNKLREVFKLKHEYGISMLAALFRTGQCGIITPATQKNLFMLFSKNGWRTQDPGKAYPHESTYLHKQLVYRALGEEYIGESKAAELLGMSVYSFHKERKLEAPLQVKLGPNNIFVEERTSVSYEANDKDGCSE